jgi:hypothetical protein
VLYQLSYVGNASRPNHQAIHIVQDITSDVLYQLSYVGVSRPRIAADLGDRADVPDQACG